MNLVTGVVDLHHHILPGVDDGATDLATAVDGADAVDAGADGALDF